MSHVVLLVDDDPGILSALTRALRKEPYTILCASSAEDALRTLRSHPVDVVISDEKMPGTHGTELLGKIREEFPDTVRYMLTGQPTLEIAMQAINEGAVSRFFIKPCNHVELAMAVRDSLRHKDLVCEAMRLLRTVKEQSALLENLEHQVPGISEVRRDGGGAVVLNREDLPEDFDEFLKEIREACDSAEEQMGSLGAAEG